MKANAHHSSGDQNITLHQCWCVVIQNLLTMETKTRSSCLLLNHTRPDHLVSYSTLQDPIILYLTQPYKTRSSCLLLNVTRSVNYADVGTKYLNDSIEE